MCIDGKHSLGPGRVEPRADVYWTIGQLVLGYIEFFGRLTEMMERLGAHLSYLTEYSKGAFQTSVKLQNVRLICMGPGLPHHTSQY